MAARLIFMGTSAFAVPALRALAGGPHSIAAVLTQPPRPAGRGQQERRSAVHEAAAELGLEVWTPPTLKTPEIQSRLAEIASDLAVVASYGLLLPQAVIDVPRRGCINLHASLLPRWRGAAPIQRAILAGDRITGISIFAIERGLDTGPVYATRPLPIGPRATAPELHDALAQLAADMLPGTLSGILDGSLRPTPQPEDGVTHARKVDRAEGRLDFVQSARQLDRQIRAFVPWPGSWFEHAGERILVLEAVPVEQAGAPGTVLAQPLIVACGNDALRIDRVQRAGRRPMTIDELRRGFAIPVGSRLA